MCISQQFGNQGHDDNKLVDIKKKNVFPTSIHHHRIVLQCSFIATMVAYINENKIVNIIIDLDVIIFI